MSEEPQSYKIPDSLNEGMWCVITTWRQIASNLYEWQADRIISNEARARWADEVARPALELSGCYFAIPCADMRALSEPDHEDCARCAALRAYPQPVQDVAP
jgi:hypothetical protein